MNVIWAAKVDLERHLDEHCAWPEYRLCVSTEGSAIGN